MTVQPHIPHCDRKIGVIEVALFLGSTTFATILTWELWCKNALVISNITGELCDYSQKAKGLAYDTVIVTVLVLWLFSFRLWNACRTAKVCYALGIFILPLVTYGGLYIIVIEMVCNAIGNLHH